MSDPNATALLTLAPLHGVTGRIVRAAWFRAFGGFDAAMAPFILAVPRASSRKGHFKDLVPPDALGVLLIPQLLGNDAESFLSTARALRDADFNLINWNLGCPYPMVAKKFRGSGLLPFPERIDAVLDYVYRDGLFAREGMRVSVKLRLGRADPKEILSLMPVLNRYPLESVIVHPRVGTQMYRGTVDIDSFNRAATLSAHPIVFNGDIVREDAFRDLSARTRNVSGWMIGRGALADPFLPARVRRHLAPPDDMRPQAALPATGSDEWLDAVRLFHDDVYAEYRSKLFGPSHVLAKMKELWYYFAPSFPSKRKTLDSIPRARGFEDYEKIVDRLFSPNVT